MGRSKNPKPTKKAKFDNDKQQQEQQRRRRTSSSTAIDSKKNHHQSDPSKEKLLLRYQRVGGVHVDGMERTTYIIPASSSSSSNSSSFQNSTNNNVTNINNHQKGNILSRLESFVNLFETRWFNKLQTEHEQALLLEDQTKTGGIVDGNGWYRGCRLINGMRYEVKVLGDFVRQHCQDDLNDPTLPQDLVTYAENQALKDPRMVQRLQEIQSESTSTSTSTSTSSAGIAITDTDTSKKGHPFFFAEWSMIVSQICQAQTTHIDVPASNLQFGLILTKNRPGTMVLLEQNYGPYTVKDLLQEVWVDAPISLKELLLAVPESSSSTTSSINSSSNSSGSNDNKSDQVFASSSDIHRQQKQYQEKIQRRVRRLLQAFGPLLRPKKDLDRHMMGAESIPLTGSNDENNQQQEKQQSDQQQIDQQQTSKLSRTTSATRTTATAATTRTTAATKNNVLQCGDMICTSGGIPHAGPACDQFRMVLFGAVSLSGQKHDLYNVEDQYFAHSAMIFFLQVLWDVTSSSSTADVVNRTRPATDIQKHKEQMIQIRKWLLHRLADTCKEYDESVIENHFYVSPPFYDLMKSFIKAKTNRTVASCIDAFLQTHGEKNEKEVFSYFPESIWNGE